MLRQHIVHVVGGDERDAQLATDLDYAGDGLFQFRMTLVALELQVKMVRAEHIAIPASGMALLFHLVGITRRGISPEPQEERQMMPSA